MQDLPPPPILSQDGRFWWDGRAWQPYPARVEPGPPPSVAPIRVTACTPTRNGADAWFADTSVDNIADLFHRFFHSLGFKFETGKGGEAQYSKGQYHWFKVTVAQQAGGVHAVVARVVASGKNTKRMSALLQMFLSDPVNLQQAQPNLLSSVSAPATTTRAAASTEPGARGGTGSRIGTVLTVALLAIALAVGLPLILGKLSNGSISPTSSGQPGPNASGVAATANPADCAISNDGSSNGVDWHTRVDATSSAPCDSHFTVTQAGGSGCQFYIATNGPYALPANVWNVTRWGFDAHGNTEVYLDDGTFLFFNCVLNVGNYPQTSLHTPDWS